MFADSRMAPHHSDVVSDSTSPPWTFLSNHAHVLLCVARDSDVRVRDVAEEVGITERAVQRILGELEEAGVLQRERRGRRNHYEVDASLPLRHPLEAHRTIGDLLRVLRRR
jgi:DNA-binding transcriptional ArsR family regulator